MTVIISSGWTITFRGPTFTPGNPCVHCGDSVFPKDLPENSRHISGRPRFNEIQVDRGYSVNEKKGHSALGQSLGTYSTIVDVTVRDVGFKGTS